MSTVPNSATVNQSPRELTMGEVQRLVTDAWQAMNQRLAPGRLHSHCFYEVEGWVKRHLPAVIPTVKELVWLNYDEAVRVLADGYYKSATSEELFFSDRLQWITPHPAIEKRRKLEVENNSETQKVAPKDMLDRAELEKVADAKAADEKAHEKAVKQIETAISTLVIQGRNGMPDQPKIDEHRARLRQYVRDNLGNSNGQKVWKIVQQSIASIHQQVERDMTRWNSR